MVHQEVQEIQELVVQVVHQEQVDKRCWYIRKFRNTGVSGMVHQEQNGLQMVQVVHQEIQELVVQAVQVD
jgi:hypothetical protein